MLSLHSWDPAPLAGAIREQRKDRHTFKKAMILEVECVYYVQLNKEIGVLHPDKQGGRISTHR